MATCDWAIVCDYAFLDVTRKVCLIGVFDRIFTPAVPSVHPQAALALRLVGNPNETVDLRAEIIRPTGELLARIEGRGELGDAGTAEVHMGMAGLQAHLVPGLGEGLGDAAPHHPGPDDGDVPDVVDPHHPATPLSGPLTLPLSPLRGRGKKGGAGRR